MNAFGLQMTGAGTSLAIVAVIENNFTYTIVGLFLLALGILVCEIDRRR